MLPEFKKTSFLLLVLIIASLTPGFASALLVGHQLDVKIDPAAHQLSVTDQLTLPADTPKTIDFILNAAMNVRLVDGDAQLVRLGVVQGAVEIAQYRVTFKGNSRRFTLAYSGVVKHDFKSLRPIPGKQRQLLAGTIEAQGVFLDAATAWYPRFDDSLQQFELKVRLPRGWVAVSQGAGPGLESQLLHNISRWREQQPQDDIYLIAARFHSYQKPVGRVQAQVFLRDDDPALAQRYLDATENYLELYQSMLGDYPYAKFALVENFWQTGYGMPSFTLLGSRVIRLPFILASSYPHEILHNWWGNGVFVDYQTGNWSEGLTAYLADHFLKEQRGQGIEYRRNSLQRFADYVRGDNDFPLRDFRARHSGSSQAVGYSKSLMLFHMLRRQIGDAAFVDGLRSFYQQQRFRHAGFDDLRKAFEQSSGRDLKDFFQQWVERTGAPLLTLTEVAVSSMEEGYELRIDLQQNQRQRFDLEVPLIVYFADDESPVERRINMQQRSVEAAFQFASRPVRVEVDPWFDLFRQLLPEESPPTLSGLLGAEQALFVLPAAASADELDGWNSLASGWAQGYGKARIVLDSEFKGPVDADAVWLLGSNNRLAADFAAALSPERFQRNVDHVLINGESTAPDQDIVMVQQWPGQQQLTAWISAQSPASIPGLARKLPHYGKYSYLTFAGEGPVNQLKGTWAITDSPLQWQAQGVEIPQSRLLPEPLAW